MPLECHGAERELGWEQGSVFFSKSNLTPGRVIPSPEQICIRSPFISLVGTSSSQSPGLLQTNTEPSPWDQVYNLKPDQVGQAQASLLFLPSMLFLQQSLTCYLFP